MRKGITAVKVIAFCALALLAKPAFSFEAKVGLQGYLKSGSSGLNGTFDYRVILLKNGTPVWAKDFFAQQITTGALSRQLSGLGDDLTSAGMSDYTGVSITTLFNATSTTDNFSANVVVDLDANGIGLGADATFTGISIVAVPLALTANNLSKMGATDGQYLVWDNSLGRWKPFTLVVNSSNITAGAVDQAAIGTGAVTSSALANDAVTTITIADSAVTTAKIADDAVTTLKILDSNVTTAKLADSSVTTTKINDTAVTTAKLADNAVTTAKITDGSVTSAKLAADAVGTIGIADGSVTTAKVADGAITNVKIANATLDLTTKVTGVLPIANGGTNNGSLGVTAGGVLYMDGSKAVNSGAGVTGQYLKSNAGGAPAWTTLGITDIHASGGGAFLTGAGCGAGQALQYNSITDTISCQTVVANSIAAGTITDAEVSASAAIAYSKLALSNSIATGDIVDANVTTAKIADANVTTAKIADSNVTTAKIADSNVTTAKINDAAVTTAKIDDSAVTNAKIADGTIDLTSKVTGALPLANGGTGNGSLLATAGGIYYGNGTKMMNTAAGSSGQYLKSTGAGVPAWTTLGITDIRSSVSGAFLTGTTCTAGQALVYNAATDTIACAAVTAGSVAAGSITNTEINAAAAIAYSKLNLAGSIVNADVSNSAAIAYSKLALSNSIVTGDVVDSAVTTAKIADANVTTAKIADANVTTVKIADSNVTTAKINDQAVTNAKIADGTIDLTAKVTGALPLANGGTNNGSLGATAGAIYYGDGTKMMNTSAGTSGQYLKSAGAGTPSWTTLGISDIRSSVSGSFLTGTTCAAGQALVYNATTDTIACAAVTAGAVAAGTITNNEINAAAAIAYSKLNLAGSIVNADVSNSAAIAYSKLALSNSIVTGDVVDSAVTTAKIADANVTTAKIADANVTAAKMAAGSVDLASTTVANTLPIARGGTNNGSLGVAAGGMVYSDGTKLVNTGAGSAGQFMKSSGTSAPTFATLSISDIRSSVTGAFLTGGTCTAGQALTYNSATDTISCTGVTASTIAAGAITNNEVSATAAIAYSKLNLANSIVAGDLTANAVTTIKINDGAVTTAKINDQAVTNIKIADGTIDLTTKVTGTLPLAKGGTNNGSLGATAGGIYYGDGTKMMNTSAGTSGQYLKSAGAGTPAWTTLGISDIRSSVSGSFLTGTTCTAGQALVYNAASDTIACATVTAGSVAAGSITNTEISNSAAIAYSKLDLANSIATGDLVDASVTTDKLADDAVTTVKITDGNVTTAKLADDAVTTVKINNGAITTAKIATSAVDLTTKVSGVLPTANGGTNNGSLGVANGGVIATDGSKMVNTGAGATGQYLKSVGAGTPAWTTLGIADIRSSVAGAFLTGSSCSAGQALIYNSTTDTISCGAVTAGSVAAGTITNNEVSASAAIAYSKLDLANSIVAGDITSNAVTTAKINDGAVTTAKIADGGVTTVKIADANVTATKMAASSVDLASSTVTGTLPVANGGTGTANGSITGTGALTFASGGTNQNITLDPSGTGVTDVKGTLRLSGSTSGYVGFAPAAAAGSTTYTLPSADGGTGYVLSTDGSGTLAWVANTAGSVTSVATGSGLTGGPITSTGTISLANIASNTVLANTTGGSAAPTATTVPALLDTVSSTQGSVLYRNGSSWVALSPGTSGQFLQTAGAAANPTWASLPAISLTSGVSGVLPVANGGTNNASLNVVAGGVVTSDGTKLVNTGAGTSGQYLKSTGAGNPSWGTLGISDLHTTGGGGGAFLTGSSCAAGEALIYSSGTDTMYCSPVTAGAIADGTVTTTKIADASVTAAKMAASSVDLATSTVTGTLPVAKGGTGATTLTANRVLIGNGTSAVAVAAAGSAGQILQSAGASAPAWSTPTYPSASGTAGKILRSDGTNNVYSTATYPDTATQYDLLYASAANTWSSLAKANTGTLVTSSTGVPSWTLGTTANRVLRTNGTAITFSQVALGTDVSGTLGVANGGTGTTTAFTQGSVVFSGASGVYSQSNANLFWDNTNFRLGIGTTSPGTALDVKGTMRLSGSSSGYVGFAPAAAAGSTTYTLPSADGSSGYVLTTDGAGVLSWSAKTTGSVTNVATGSGLTGGPITSTGTISLATIANNTILANTSGSTGVPTATSLSTLLDTVSSTQGSIMYRNGSTWTSLAPGTSGQFLKTQGAAANPVWANEPNTGTVTSVAMSVPSFLSVTGSPITTSGTLAVTLANQTAETVLAGPTSGGAAAPTFRTLDITDIKSTGSGDFLTGTSCAAGEALIYAAGTDTMYCSAVTAGTVAAGTITNAMVNASAAIAYSKLNLTNSIVAGDITAGAVTAAKMAASSVDLASSTVTGTLPLANGGTGSTTGSITGSGALTFTAGGSNQNVTLQPSGTGVTDVKGTLRLSGSTSGYVGFAPAAVAGTTTYTLPSSDGTSGYVLTTDGSGVLSWSAKTTGSVTSVATGSGLTGGPITSTGTISLANIADGTVLANTSGSSGVPTATTVTGLLDTLSSTQGTILYRNGSAWVGLAPGTSGQFLKTQGAGANPVWAAEPNTGTVTSVAMTVPSFLSVTGSPVTTSGTLAVSLANQNADTVLAGPTSGGAAAPSFRTLDISDIKSTGAGDFLTGTSCGSGEALVYAAGTDTMYCSSIPLTLSQITTALTFTPLNKAGDTMTGTLTLPSNGLVVGTTQLVVSGAKVGVGTASPGTTMDVQGTTTTLALVEGAASSVNSSTAYTIPDISRSMRRITLNGNATITLPSISGLAADSAYSLTVRITQDATGSRTLAWAGNSGQSIKWDQGSAPAVASAANTETIYQFMIVGGETTWYATQTWKEQ